MGKLKNVTVTITREKRNEQKWKYTIDEVGGGTELRSKDRFATQGSTERSALGKLDAQTVIGVKGRSSRYTGLGPY